MFIKIHVSGFKLSDKLKSHAESKARLMLGLYVDRISRVDMYLADVNGPKGGEDMLCKIKVDVLGQKPVIVQQNAETLREAIDICAHRAKRTVARKFERISEHTKPRQHGQKLSRMAWLNG